MPIIGNDFNIKKSFESLIDGKDGCASHIFYVNRFHHREGEQYDEIGGDDE